MRIANQDIADEAGRKTPITLVSVLEDLLSESLRLRDLYKTARRQSGGSALLKLWQIFDAHYREQLRVVDVLIDRVRTLGGVGRVFAGDFLQAAQTSGALGGRHAWARMLQALLEGHESIMIAARSGEPNGDSKDSAWSRDFAVGQVVLANEEQMQLLGKLLRVGSDYPGAAAHIALIED